MSRRIVAAPGRVTLVTYLAGTVDRTPSLTWLVLEVC